MAAVPRSPLTTPSRPFLGTRTSPHTPQLRTPTRPRQYKNLDFSSPTPLDNPRKAFLRERLRQRFFDRTRQAREKKITTRRSLESNAPSSDGFDCEMDDEDQCDQEDSTLNDELFRRIMASARHKAQHNYRLSYQLSVGSSVDPDMEDVVAWENELQGTSSSAQAEELPGEFDDDELAAYAEEYTALEDFDACADNIFSSSDFDDIDLQDESSRQTAINGPDDDVGMHL